WLQVDSANKHGILLELVQVLTDLDLLISKSYISSDGGWFMDVFHVTDQLGNKLTDETLILYIQQAICASRRGSGISKELQLHPSYFKKDIRPRHVSSENTALEITGIDRPGLLSEISAVLAELHFHVTAAVAWTHNKRAAMIIYVEEGMRGGGGGGVIDSRRLTHVQEQLEMVVEAHHGMGDRMSVRLTDPGSGRTHTERRLHQLLCADMDYKPCKGCNAGGDGLLKNNHRKDCTKIHVTIEPCQEKGYSVVNVRSRDRPKLLFDTVCALTDMEYVVFHAAVSSLGSLADQEYYIRQKDGCTLETESERHRLSQCLIAAIERRVCDGLRLDICTRDRKGLLSDVTRAFRENGLSIARAEIGRHGETAIGTFYVTETSGDYVSQNTVELVKKELGESLVVVNKYSYWNREIKSPAWSSSASSDGGGSGDDSKPRFSLGTLFWSQLGWLSGNFGSSVRS
ncbi:ACT domain-containing protein ACR1, partial [Linum grandiflorum]